MNNALGILGWIAATLLTFLAVSLAFLFLANIGSSPEDVRIDPRSNVSTTGSQLAMTLNAEEIETLTPRSGQTFTITLTNEGDRPLRDINVIAEVSSEDTSLSDNDLYNRTLPRLAAGQSEDVLFGVNLSENPENYSTPEPPRRIIEIQATTPEGISTTTTVVLQTIPE